MKTPGLSVAIVVLVLVALLASGGAARAQAGQPGPQVPTGGGGPGPMFNAFTYQGQLKLNGGPVTASCDFQFSLWDSSGSGNPPTGGSNIGLADNENNVPVTNGLFSVTLNLAGQFDPGSTIAFSGDMRYLMIGVRCPGPGSGNYVTLGPRQLITAAPYAIGLVPGAHIFGDKYQVVKVENTTTQTNHPAGVTGEIMNSSDGVGVYGSNTVTASNATGAGVWGRSWSPNGAGVKGTGMGSGASGAVGVYAEGSGQNQYHAALYAKNTDTGATFPAGIAMFGENASVDATLVLRNWYHNSGTNAVGLLIAGIKYDNSTVVYSVDGKGHVISTLLTTTAGSDLAEQFPVSAAPEPGTLMVIDADHPGQLKPSDTPYDTKVAGVVSGAGGLQAGMTLAEQDGLPIALAGRVYVKAEANSAPIQPGDLLTSSALPGCAMKATDRSLAAGAVIGKAMTRLDSGAGLVLVLVSLQ